MDLVLTPAAQLINDIFGSLDYAILSFYHSLAESAGVVMTPLMVFISYFGKGGIFFIVTSIVLICIKKTRRVGITCLAGIMIGALFTNLLIKPLVLRPRPYNFSEEIRTWWTLVGSHSESDYSFPSGHTTVVCDFSAAFCGAKGKKYIPFAALAAMLMGVSRNYLMVHYPSDIIGGIIIGTQAGIAAALIVNLVYQKIAEKKLIDKANRE